MRSDFIAMLGGAEEYEHESDDSSVEDDTFDDDGGSDEDEECDEDCGSGDWPVAEIGVPLR